jgi:O-antigen/teichoic acid export membrane protein
MNSKGFHWKQTIAGMVMEIADRKSFVALFDQGIVSIANFLTGLIIGRICTKEQFGLYMLGFTIITMGMNIQDSLILTPYTIYSPRLKGSAHAQYMGSTFIHQLLYSICIIFLLLIFRIALSLGIGPLDLVPVVDALTFVIGFILFRNYARRVSFAALKMRSALVLDFLVSLLQISGLITLSYLNALAASSAYWIVGIACGVGTFYWMMSQRKEFQFTHGQMISDLRQNFSTGSWILASGFIWTMVISLYPWLLATFYGTASTGVWAACLGILTLINPFFLGMQNSFSPKIAHAYADKGGGGLRHFSLQATTVFGAVLVPFCVVLLFFGEHLVIAIYGTKYAGTGSIVSLLALNFLVSALSFPLSRALFTIGRADVDFKINLIMLLCLLSFGILLVRSFGPIGAATSLLIMNVICLIFRYIAFHRLVHADADKTVPESESYEHSVTEM